MIAILQVQAVNATLHIKRQETLPALRAFGGIHIPQLYQGKIYRLSIYNSTFLLIYCDRETGMYKVGKAG